MMVMIKVIFDHHPRESSRLPELSETSSERAFFECRCSAHYAYSCYAVSPSAGAPHLMLLMVIEDLLDGCCALLSEIRPCCW